MTRQVKRIQKAIDELIKIADDGYATDTLQHTLDDLRGLETYYETATRREIGNAV